MKMTLSDTISLLSLKSIEEIITFNENLLFNITVMNRAIWSDIGTTSEVKVECLKWSNELSHRIWGILFKLKNGDCDKLVVELGENINFYGKQSKEFSGHLACTIISMVEKLD